MEMNEFLNGGNEQQIEEVEELDVQKAVVEEFAAEKAEMAEQIDSLRKDNYERQSQISKLNEEIGRLREELGRLAEGLTRNVESNLSSQISLLDRDVDISDNFNGETRDHVLEVIREAYKKDEQEGRVRRAFLLESVLKANEPLGELARRRTALEKLFSSNSNLVTGPVIDELNKCGISYKNGEEYLLPQEILKRNY